MDDVIENVEIEEIEEIEGDEPVDEVNEDIVVPKRHKVKIDGEELEVDEEELLSGYQRAQASQKRFEQAAKQMKDIEDLLIRGKQDPATILTALGIDPLEFIEGFVQRQLEEESLTDEQRELRDLRSMKAKQQEEFDKHQKLLQEQEAKQRQEQFAQKLDSDITLAFAEAGIQPNPKLIARVAEQLLADLNSGKELDARSALARTQNDIQAELAHLLTSSPEQYLSKADKKQIEKLRKYFLKDVSSVDDEAPVERQASNRKDKRASLEDIFGDMNLL